MRARGEECSEGGMTEGGDDAMFGNRCLRAHAQGPSVVVGGVGGWGSEEGGRSASS